VQAHVVEGSGDVEAAVGDGALTHQPCINSMVVSEQIWPQM
jgi:hypothetical protein